ncbi:peroxiredoxin [Thiomicrospira sp. WB1]|uniref:peroxiredoxin n=1 Tax=Thiomicrospira sp. WB1 TaxID=1685380 RepID=UPI00074680A8|nr:peroxiredoxin [Thiomicrospira sp. WB1]KUJ72985.1 alkyl hydroperoxide reductase [Thiomicrospira sp. WB1]
MDQNVSSLTEQIPAEHGIEWTRSSAFHLDTLFNHWTVLYFYPRDNTPGCTTEGLDFAQRHEQFKSLDAQILGVSKDSLRKHRNFIEKQGFPFDLISDPEEHLCRAFDVIKLKKNYGREYYGIERSTFLIDPQGCIRQAWRKVKVKEHAETVLQALKHEQSA